MKSKKYCTIKKLVISLSNYIGYLSLVFFKASKYYVDFKKRAKVRPTKGTYIVSSVQSLIPKCCCTKKKVVYLAKVV